MNLHHLPECLLVNIYDFCQIKDLLYSPFICKHIHKSLKGALSQNRLWIKVPTGLSLSIQPESQSTNQKISSMSQFEDLFCIVYNDSKFVIFKDHIQEIIYEGNLKCSILLCFNHSKILLNDSNGLLLIDYKTLSSSERYLEVGKLDECLKVRMNDKFMFGAHYDIDSDVFEIVQFDLYGNELQSVYEKYDPTYSFEDFHITNKFLVARDGNTLMLFNSSFSCISRLDLPIKTYFRMNENYIFLWESKEEHAQVRLLKDVKFKLFDVDFTSDIHCLMVSNFGLFLTQRKEHLIEFKKFLH